MANNEQLIISKYYLNDEGVGTLLEEIAEKIKAHTSDEIITSLGNSGREADSPYNFTTTKAVVDYLVNRAKISINLQTTTSKLEDELIEEEDYQVNDNLIEYNGEDGVLINLKLASENDIKNLFN